MRKWAMLAVLMVVAAGAITMGQAWAQPPAEQEVPAEQVEPAQEPAVEENIVEVAPAEVVAETVIEAVEEAAQEIVAEVVAEVVETPLTPIERFDAALSELRTALTDRASWINGMSALDAEVSRLQGLLAVAQTDYGTEQTAGDDVDAAITAARDELFAAVDALIAE